MIVRSLLGKESAMKPIYLFGKPWTRREVLIWLSALIVMVVFGVLSVTNVLGSWALLVVCVFALGVALMRYRAEVKWNGRRVEHGADRPES